MPQHGARTHESAPAPKRGFDAAEVARILARYDIGTPRSVRPFERGDPASPKAVVQTDAGRFLLKRRPPATSDPDRVAFSHHAQMRAHQRGIPTPSIIATRDDASSALVMDDLVYELFQYVEGVPWTPGPPGAHAAGRTLAQLHGAMDGFTSPWAPPRVEPDAEPDLERAAARVPAQREAFVLLLELWRAAGTALEQRGLRERPTLTLHADWHPGNTVWAAHEPPKRPVLIAVLDFAEARPGPPVVDLASGSLHFALRRPADNTPPDQWPFRPDPDRLRAFWAGYREGIDRVRALRTDERGAKTSSIGVDAGGAGDAALAPWIMIRVVVAELARAFAATGRFGSLDPGAMLRFVTRLAADLAERPGELAAAMARPAGTGPEPGSEPGSEPSSETGSETTGSARRA